MQEFRRALVELRDEAARTPPPDDPAPVQGSKKKMPAKLALKLELLTRPFYLSAEAATSTNRAKKLLWGVLMPVLTTWSAEPTIKTKMQKINSHIIGQYTLAKERFEQIARWHGAPPPPQLLQCQHTLLHTPQASHTPGESRGGCRPHAPLPQHRRSCCCCGVGSGGKDACGRGHPVTWPSTAAPLRPHH